MAKTLLQEHEETNNDTTNNDEGDSNEEGKLRKNFRNCSVDFETKSSLVGVNIFYQDLIFSWAEAFRGSAKGTVLQIIKLLE